MQFNKCELDFLCLRMRRLHIPFLIYFIISVNKTRLDGSQGAMKIVPRDSLEALSLSHEGRVYIKMQHLWGNVVPRLMACGLDGEGNGYLLVTRLIANSRHINPQSDGHLVPQAMQALEAVHDVGICHGDLRLENILVGEEEGICDKDGGTREGVAH